MNRVSINEFLSNPIENSDCFSNFYDWFCSDRSLEKRMMAMVPKLKFLVKEGLLNGDTNYVWFKNNCPMDGSLYDDMRISTLDENQDFLGGFCPRTGHHVEDKCSFWTISKDRGLKTYEFKDWSTFKKEVKTNEELRAILIKNFG